jgi:anaerobic magnesium-protoporphyrin IX monomethyl ester cyclase
VYCWNAGIVYEVLDILYEIMPDQKIVLGGPEVGPIAEELHERFPQLTYIVKGEGEQAICDVVHALTHDRDLSLLPQREPIANLDMIPSPYSDAYPPAIDGSAYIETFRGCPHACAYCYEGKGVARIRSFSWKRIEKDIERIATTPGMKSFSFVDSVFNLTRDRLQRLSDILAPYAERGLCLHTIEVDIESIDDEQAALLKRAGVVSVETGPQTTGEKALTLCNRSLDKDAYLRGVEACKRAGIRVEADLIIGLPGDTVSDVLDSFQFVVDADPGVIQASTLHVLPGTQLWDCADEFGLHFDKNPPHEVIKTADITYTDLRNLEVFGLALGALYRARL